LGAITSFDAGGKFEPFHERMNRPIDPNMILNETCVIRFISAAESIQEHELLL
jgi:hypothetical protein